MLENNVNEFVFNLKTKYSRILDELTIILTNENDVPYLQLVLIKIKASQRCKGYGSTVMYDICKYADINNVRIRLWVTSGFGSQQKRLYEFYKKHGFILIKNGNVGEMLYYPQKL